MYSENHELSLNRHLDQIRGSTIKVSLTIVVKKSTEESLIR